MENVFNDLEKNDKAARPGRDRLLSETDKKLEILDKRIDMWEKDLKLLKEGDPNANPPVLAEADQAKVAKIQAQLDRAQGIKDNITQGKTKQDEVQKKHDDMGGVFVNAREEFGKRKDSAIQKAMTK